jgi:DTW domain-containing protein YfiP
MIAAEPAHRPHCYRCDKPVLSCLCAHIERVDNQTPIVIVQHKHESRHPFGTVRIAELGLAKARIHTVPGWAVSGDNPPEWLPAGAGLLYPGHAARDLGSLAPAERPAALVLLDGTWNQARALFRDHAWLRTLPRYAFTPSTPSRYRIRREPRPSYVSTIEAVVQALSLLEPGLAGTAGLLAAFEHLIDVQIEQCSKRQRASRPRDRRPQAVRYLPRRLVDDFDGLVLVYGEASQPEHDATAAPELVHWAALRLRDRSTFDCVLRPSSGPPSAERLFHLGLSRSDFDTGVEPDEFARRWAKFIGHEGWVAAWNPRTLAHFERCTGSPLEGIGLKGVHGRVRGRDAELDLSTQLDHELGLPAALTAALAAVRGRARHRLSNALSCALGLQRLALG